VLNAKEKTVRVLGVLIVSGALYYVSSGTLSLDERSGLLLLGIAGGLWLTRPIPLAATAILIPVMQVFLGIQKLEPSLGPFFDPVILLLLGGFLLAVMVEKYELDKYMAYRIVNRVRAEARYVILMLMLFTSIISMWISNTASTSLMLPLVMKLHDDQNEEVSNFTKISVLSIAYSATAGGLGSLLGTTTPAMAVSVIRKMTGYDISFVEWCVYGLPITLLMVLLIWVIVFRMFPTDVKTLSYEETGARKLDREQRLGAGVFLFAVLLWVTAKIPGPLANLVGWSGHGLSTALVAGIIALVLFFFGLLDKDDFRKAKWRTILLIGGSLSLGDAMETSGLSGRIIELLLPVIKDASSITVLVLVGFLGLCVSMIASNTASAGIILPIAVKIGTQTGISPVVLGIMIGVTTSLDFMLPVGTPPNAIAYSTGKVDMSDMVKAGILLDIIGVLITVALAYLLWPRLI
jgi:sodium-dependent dicarboxylate transporter 2/3/5